MNKQEILQTLNMPSVPDFPTLHSLCQDPGLLEDVLSLAITKGEMKGRADAARDHNRMSHGASGSGETEKISQVLGPSLVEGT